VVWAACLVPVAGAPASQAPVRFVEVYGLGADFTGQEPEKLVSAVVVQPAGPGRPSPLLSVLGSRGRLGAWSLAAGGPDPVADAPSLDLEPGQAFAYSPSYSAFGIVDVFRADGRAMTRLVVPGAAGPRTIDLAGRHGVQLADDGASAWFFEYGSEPTDGFALRELDLESRVLGERTFEDFGIVRFSSEESVFALGHLGRIEIFRSWERIEQFAACGELALEDLQLAWQSSEDEVSFAEIRAEEVREVVPPLPLPDLVAVDFGPPGAPALVVGRKRAVLHVPGADPAEAEVVAELPPEGPSFVSGLLVPRPGRPPAVVLGAIHVLSPPMDLDGLPLRERPPPPRARALVLVRAGDSLQRETFDMRAWTFDQPRLLPGVGATFLVVWKDRVLLGTLPS